MVARSGAGPEPIPYRLLNVESLSAAIGFCTEPKVLKAAEGISIKMQAECGVKTAVDSFHHNLPLNLMRCHIFPDQPAVWRYKKGSNKPLYLSKLASQILIDHLKVEPKRLQQ